MRVLTNIPKGKPIDVTLSKKLGPQLAEEILELVKDTQKYIVNPLPDRLILTKDQFSSLEADMTRFEETEDRFWLTKYNIMEVEVVR